MYVFEESFKCWDDSYKPYGITVESSSKLWHKHARATENGYTVYCTGNKYLLNMPETKDFTVTVKYSFEVLHTYGGISIFFGYHPSRHSGYELRAEWQKNARTMTATVYSIVDERYTTVATALLEDVEFPRAGEEYTFVLRMANGQLIASPDENKSAAFQLSCNSGMLGFSRPNFVGSVSFRSIRAESESVVVENEETTTVTIPTVNGGTMPLAVQYNRFTANGKPYLTAILDGGPQYRTAESYCPYPVNRQGQYVVERWFMDKPYVCVDDKRFYFSMGDVNLADPFLAWKEQLYPLMHFVDLPISITVPIDTVKPNNYSFGYENLTVYGYRLQGGKNEFNFTVSGEYLGETLFPDTFRLCSPEDKRAVKLIPETAFQYQTVKSHFERNHYFAEGEDISFKIYTNTDKKYITYEAELQNVYWECIEKLSVVNGEIRHSPLPVGVYRIHLTVKYGNRPFKELDTAFEVFDESGKRCAPLESGLPVLFSMPNEQQYLDRDPFDPWNDGAPANVEHLYSCTAFTGHVAEYKRTWEITKLFGRSWYVWLSNHRTMVDHDYRDHMDIIKNADYVYYPSDYEWGVLRSDCYTAGLWNSMPKTLELLNDFLDSHEGAREKVGYNRGEKVTRDHITMLHKHYMHQWYSLLQEKTTECFTEQNKLFKSLNPNFKRACYGPFNVYISTMRTTKMSEFYGLKTGNTLSDVIYTGFAQFEDYPYSCAYQTYRGAFGAGATLVHSPSLVIYPEQYKSSPGGCIDGAVYFANPPIGKYVMPGWFNTTLTREYVYNTPRKTDDSFAYWSTYGFMKSDMTDDDINPFIHDWKYILRYQPKRPHRSTVYICEFDSNDDGFEEDFPAWRAPYNISEEGVGYLYETSRLAGLPSGFFASWESLLTLTSEDTDLIVLPSTASAPPQALAHIRALHNDGVAIIAISRVDGLEDLFGVRYSPREVRYYGIDTKASHEDVYPYTAFAGYESDGADTLLTADGTPVIFKHGNTALYNVSPSAVGRSYFYAAAESARSSISTLLRESSIDLICRLSTPEAFTDDGKCGITLLDDTNGNTLLLVIDYSEHDSAKQNTVNEKCITFGNNLYRRAESIDGKPLRCLYGDNGVLDGITVALHPHESALIQLL